jgi:DnaJ-class molecular chaperone
VRFKNKTASHDEIVVIIRVEHHPWLSITERGLTMEIPLTVGEAIEGAKIQVPSLGEPLLVTVAPLTQSGKQVRLKNQGITNRDGTREDLYIRFIVVVPDKPLPEEIRSVSEMLAETYSHPPRQHLPAHILEGQ